jgi:hypothetical protein
MSRDVFKQFKVALLRSPEVTERDALLFMGVNGLAGTPTQSLRRIGGLHKLSGERVRQICEKINSSVLPDLILTEHFKPLAVEIDSILMVVEDCIPDVSHRVTETLVDKGVIPVGTLSSSVIRMAKIVGRPMKMKLAPWGRQEAIVPDGPDVPFKTVMRAARRTAHPSGAFGLRALSVAIAAELKVENSKVRPEYVLDIIRPMTAPYTRFLAHCENDDWYFLTSGPNDAITRALNRIAALGWCSVDQLSDVSRSLTQSKYLVSLPNEVMERLLLAHDISVVDGRVSKDILPRGAKYRLSKVQQKMIDVLQAMGGEAEASGFVNACHKKGVRKSTARAYIYRSKLFECTEGICTLKP